MAEVEVVVKLLLEATVVMELEVEAVEVVAAVGGRVPVFVDGGVRRGTDVFKALALGAKAVGIGRPYLWGLGAFGRAGVDRVLEVVAHVGDAISPADHLALRRTWCRAAPGMVADAVERLGEPVLQELAAEQPQLPVPRRPWPPEHHRGNTGVHGLGHKGFEKRYGITEMELRDSATKILHEKAESSRLFK